MKTITPRPNNNIPKLHLAHTSWVVSYMHKSIMIGTPTKNKTDTRDANIKADGGDMTKT